MDNNTNDYKRTGYKVAGGIGGLGAVDHMFRTSARGANLGKAKFVRPILTAYGAYQGSNIGNRVYNVAAPMQKQADWTPIPHPSPRQGPVYNNDPNLNYQQHPSAAANKLMSGVSRVGSAFIGAGVGHLTKHVFKKTGFRGPGFDMVTAAMPLAGAYLGYKSGGLSNVQNAYTAMPNV